MEEVRFRMGEVGNRRGRWARISVSVVYLNSLIPVSVPSPSLLPMTIHLCGLSYHSFVINASKVTSRAFVTQENQGMWITQGSVSEMMMVTQGDK